MKLVFLVITILINLFNHSSIKSEEKIDLETYKIDNIVKKKSIIKNANFINISVYLKIVP